MIKGYLDQVNQRQATGWAFEPDAPKPLRVRAVLEGVTLAEGCADRMRPDVAAQLKTSGSHGFTISLPQIAPDSLDKIEVEAQHGETWVKLKRSTRVGLLDRLGINRTNPRKPGTGYQDFDGDGDSKSHKKLDALSLNAIPPKNPGRPPLEGLSVLDLGCNEGFFCIEAVRQGASRIVGIDFKPEFVAAARKRCPEATFIHGSWWDLPDERFDVIFFLSAIHYEPRQKELLEKLRLHLTPTGRIILECGVFQETGIRAWRTVKRGDGLKRYPTQDLLIHDLLNSYAVRPVGRSVAQAGDPVPRYVYHCSPKQSTALLVMGVSLAGKSNLSFAFEEKGIPAYTTDVLLMHLLSGERHAWRPIAAALRSRFSPEDSCQLNVVGTFIAGEEAHVDELCEIIVSECPAEAQLFCIQGEILRHPNISQRLQKKLSARSVRAWMLTSA
jgi:SAM-dependent methyltransferase